MVLLFTLIYEPPGLLFLPGQGADRDQLQLGLNAYVGRYLFLITLAPLAGLTGGA